MKRHTSTYSTDRGGYVKRHKAKTGVVEIPEPVVVKRRKPLLPGIDDALKMMSVYLKELKSITREPLTVSIDPLDGEWVLVVRGWEPPHDYFNGYKVKYIKSSFIRNPEAKR